MSEGIKAVVNARMDDFFDHLHRLVQSGENLCNIELPLSFDLDNDLGLLEIELGWKLYIQAKKLNEFGTSINVLRFTHPLDQKDLQDLGNQINAFEQELKILDRSRAQIVNNLTDVKRKYELLEKKLADM